MEGLEVGVALGPELRCDLQAPGQRGGSAEEFLVEVVAPAPDRLREGDARRDRVSDRRQRHAEPARADPGA